METQNKLETSIMMPPGISSKRKSQEEATLKKIPSSLKDEVSTSANGAKSNVNLANLIGYGDSSDDSEINDENENQTAPKKIETFKNFADFDKIKFKLEEKEKEKPVIKTGEIKVPRVPVTFEVKSKTKNSPKIDFLPPGINLLKAKGNKINAIDNDNKLRSSLKFAEKPKWREVFDKGTGKYYYWNALNDETTWEKPSKFVPANTKIKISKNENENHCKSEHEPFSKQKETNQKVEDNKSTKTERGEEEEKTLYKIPKEDRFDVRSSKESRKHRKSRSNKEDIKLLCHKIKRKTREYVEKNPDFKDKKDFVTFYSSFETRKSDWKQKEISSKYFFKVLKRALDDFCKLERKTKLHLSEKRLDLKEKFSKRDKNEEKWEQIKWQRVYDNLTKRYCYFPYSAEDGKGLNWVDKSAIIVKKDSLGIHKISMLGKPHKILVGNENLMVYKFEDEIATKQVLEKLGIPIQKLSSKYYGLDWKEENEITFKFKTYRDKVKGNDLSEETIKPSFKSLSKCSSPFRKDETKRDKTCTKRDEEEDKLEDGLNVK